MWLMVVTSAAASDAVLLLRVIDPSGATRIDRELPVPVVQSFDYSDGKRSYELHVRAEGVAEAPELRFDSSLAVHKKSGPRDLQVERSLLPEGEPRAVSLSDEGEAAWQVDARWVAMTSPLPQAPEPIDAGRFVLLWDDAPLRPDPRDKEAAERLRDLPEGRVSPWDQASPFKAIHAFGKEWMEVETTPEAAAPARFDPHCYAGADPPREHPFQHYARLDDALDVTSREISADYPDGTGYVVAAGTIVSPIPERAGRYAVLLPELRFDVSAPDGVVGKVYVPSGHFPRRDEGWRVQPGDGGIVGTMGDVPVRWEGSALPVAQGRAGVTQPIVTLRAPCAEVRIKVDEARLERGAPASPDAPPARAAARE